MHAHTSTELILLSNSDVARSAHPDFTIALGLVVGRIQASTSLPAGVPRISIQGALFGDFAVIAYPKLDTSWNHTMISNTSAFIYINALILIGLRTAAEEPSLNLYFAMKRFGGGTAVVVPGRAGLRTRISGRL